MQSGAFADAEEVSGAALTLLTTDLDEDAQDIHVFRSRRQEQSLPLGAVKAEPSQRGKLRG